MNKLKILQFNKIPVFFLCNLILFCIFTLLNMMEFEYLFIGDDDMYRSIGDTVKYSFFNADHGSTTGWINQGLSYYIPEFLHIHPQDWAVTFGRIFRAASFVYMAFLLSQLAFINNKDKKFQPFIFILTYISFWIAMSKNMQNYIVFTPYCRFVIPFIFFALLILIYGKYFITEAITDNKKIITLLCIFAFFTATSGEIVLFMSIFVIICMILYSLIAIFKEKIHLFPSLKEFIFKKPAVLIPAVVFIASFAYFMIFTHNSFAYHRGEIDYIFYKQILSNLSLIKDFLYAYNEEIVYPNFIILCLIILFAIINFIFFKKQKEDLRTNILGLFIAFGILSFFFLMIFMGKTFNYIPENPNRFWIAHTDIKVTLSIMLLASLMVQSSVIISNIGKKLFLIIFIFALSVVCFIFIKQNVYEVIKFNYNMFKYWRKEFYVRDKILLHGYYNNMAGILYDTNSCVEQVNSGYITAIYKVNVKCSEEAENLEDAIRIFKENGGVLSDKELNELNFQKLYDKDFILNNK